jgi:DNA-binding transcriptional LysR family regulator
MLFHELRQRRLDLIILLTFDDPVTDDDIVSEALYEDRIVVVAAANHPLTRRRRIELADLVNENWTLPDPGHPVAKIVAEGFRANGLQAPRVTVTTAPCRLRDTLLTTGRFSIRGAGNRRCILHRFPRSRCCLWKSLAGEERRGS